MNDVYITVRRTGRTKKMVEKAIFHAMRKNKKVLIVVHSAKFRNYIYDLFLHFIDRNKFYFTIDTVRGDIGFPNGSIVSVCSAHSLDNMRGYSFNVGFIDHNAHFEIGRFGFEVYDNIVRRVCQGYTN